MVFSGLAHVDPEQRDAILKCVRREVPDPGSAPMSVTSFYVQGRDFSAYGREARFEGGELVIECTQLGREALKPVWDDALRNQPAVATLANGWRVEAEKTAPVGNLLSTRFTSHHWQVKSGAPLPRFWTGELRLPEHGHHVGNLSFAACDGDHQRHKDGRGWRFRGRYEYFVLDTAGDTVVCIDTGDASLERDVLFDELIALQFVLGARIQIPRLRGFDVTGACTALVGGPFGWTSDPVDYRRCFGVAGELVFKADDPFVRDAWLVDFFERLTREMKGKTVPIAYFLHAIGDTVEGETMKLHVGLEALADRFTANAPAAGELDARLSRKTNEWKEWCAKNKSAIEALAADGKAAKLFEQVKRAHQIPRSSVVRSALEQHGEPALVLPDEIVAFLKVRDDLMHSGTLPDWTDVDALLMYPDVPRSLFVALLAKWIGYRGPILGYDSDDNYPSPSWWPVDAVPPGTARTWFVTTDCAEPEPLLP